MLKRVALLALTTTFLLSGCNLKYRDSVKEYRSEKLQLQFPDWPEEDTRKVASRRVEIGMPLEMVVAALGTPDSVSQEGDEEKWGYAVQETRGLGDVRLKFVYFVYFKNGLVIKTEGNRMALATLSWFE